MSVSDRKFRIKTAQPCHSDCYCFGKWPLCSGKLERTRGRNPGASLSPRAAEGCDLRETGQPALPGTSGSPHRGPCPIPAWRRRSRRGQGQ